MKNDLFLNLMEGHTAVSLAGMCKNAGKTTVLNRLLKELGDANISVGITSIGRDGESVDVATGTKKPRIYIREGTLFATSSELLRNCDVTGEILETTGMYTPLGQVVALRAKSDGYIDLAGPSMNQQLAKLSQWFLNQGVHKSLIDGAISRKSLCTRQVADAVLLCTGASYHRNIQRVIEDTAYISRLLQLKRTLKEAGIRKITSFRKSRKPDEKLLFLDQDGNFNVAEPGQKLIDALRETENQEYPFLWLEGALTDAMLKPLLFSNVSCKNKSFVVEDSSKLLLSQDTYEKLRRKGIQISVLEEITLLAITVNPFSAYGNHFEKQEFLERMQQAVSLPVFDVLEGME